MRALIHVCTHLILIGFLFLHAKTQSRVMFVRCVVVLRLSPSVFFFIKRLVTLCGSVTFT